MTNIRVYVALLVVLAAIVGAALHPLVLLLSVAPFNTRQLVSFLAEFRAVIADVLGWGLLSLLVVMVIYVVAGRTRRKLGSAGASKSPIELRNPRVVVAVTAYNDDEATAETVRDFARQPGVIKVIAVDNNSTDDTAAMAAAAGATVVPEARQGYGYACMRGLAEGLKVPDADVIVLTEGDGSFVAEDLPKFLAYIGDADLVVGNRVVRGLVDRDSQMDHFFTWGNMAVAMLLRLRFWDGRFLGPAGLSDVGCTFRAIRREALERILPDLSDGGYIFSPHMLLVAMAHDLSVVEIPIRLRRRIGESKGASQSLWKGLAIGLAMIWHITTFRLKPSAKSGAAAGVAARPATKPAVIAGTSGTRDK